MLLPDVDVLLDRDRAFMGTMMTEFRGGNPYSDPPAFGYPEHMHVEIERQLWLHNRRNKEMNENIFLNPNSPWQPIKKFMDNVFATYKAQNDSPSIKKGDTPEAQLAQMQQMKPVHVDPNELANIRQMAMQVDRTMKMIDPRSSFWTDPRTKGYADWINRESGVGDIGFMQAEEQPVELGWAKPAVMAWQGIEGIASPAMNVLFGAHDMARRGIIGMGGPDIGSLAPNNYLETEDGQIVHNGGKVPTIMDGITMAWAFATNQNMEAYSANVNRLEAWEEANRRGFGGLLTSVSRLGGELIGMGPLFHVAGKAGSAAFGELTKRGLQALGTLRLAKGVQQSERAMKIIDTMSRMTGQATGMATYQMIAEGKTEGYTNAFLHGLAMAPVIMTLGYFGKRTEWFAQNRMQLSGMASKALSGAIEGAGFGAVEIFTPDLLPSAWDFVREPNESTWETYFKNGMAFALVKMISGRTLLPQGVEAQVKRGIGRAQAAEQVARGEMSPEAIAKLPSAKHAPSPEEHTAKLKEYGEALVRSRDPNLPEGERLIAQQRARELQAELDVFEAGRGPAQDVTDEIRKQPPGEVPVAEGEELPTTPVSEIRAKPGEPDFGVPPEKTVGIPRRWEGWPQAERLHGKPIADTLRRFEEETDISIGGLTRMSGDRVSFLIGKGQTLKGLGHEELARKMGVESKNVGYIEGTLEQINKFIDAIRGEEGGQGPKGRPPPEVVPGAPGKPIIPLEEQGVEGERRRIEGEERRLRQSVDPLEDPRFADLPPEVRDEINAAKTVQERKEIFDAFAEERRVSDVPRETPSELEMRGPSGIRAGPQSFQVPPTTQVEPLPGAKPTAARDIIADMQGRPGSPGLFGIGKVPGDVVQTPMQGGHIGRKGVAGLFNMFGNFVTTLEGRDLVASAHEWAHAMHRHTSGAGGREFIRFAKQQINALVKGPNGAAFLNEMATVLKDYPGSDKLPRWLRWMETWAEWHARDLLGEIDLNVKLPTLTKFFTDLLNQNPRLLEQYNRIKQGLWNYNAQGSLMRHRMSRVSGAAPLSEAQRAQQPSWWRRTLTKLNALVLDEFAELKASQDRWLKAVGRKPEDVSILEDPARLGDALHMTSSKTVEHFIMRGIKLPGKKRVGGIREIFDSEKAKGRMEEFMDLVVAIRNMDYLKAGKATQLPEQDLAHVIKTYQTRYPDMQASVDKLKLWTDALVDYAVGAGSISKEDGANIKKAYTVYVPFFRAIEGPRQHGQGRGVATAERGTGFGQAKGSTYEIKDPFIALQQVARNIVEKAHAYQVQTALYKMAHGHEAGALAHVVPKDKIPHTHPIEKVLDALQRGMEFPPGSETLVAQIFDTLQQFNALNEGTITLFTQATIPKGEIATVAYTPRLSEREIKQLVAKGAHESTLRQQNHKLQWLRLDTKVYEAMMGIDKMPQLPEKFQPAMQVVQGARDLVRFFATGINIAFVPANIIRDMFSAPLFDRHGDFKPFGGIYKWIRGGILYHTHDKLRDLFETLGVKTASFWTEGRQRELIGEKMTLWQQTKAWADSLQNWFSHPENYIRMSEFADTYKAALKAGKSRLEAQMEALEAGREITVNFARAGIVARVMNQMLPYFNAGLQGQRKLWGQLIHGGLETKGEEAKARVRRGAMLNGIANITLPAIALWLTHKDEEWYQDLPDWRKIGYFNFKWGDTIVSIPKPFEAGVLFASLPEVMLDNMMGKNPASAASAMRALGGPFLEGLGAYIPAIVKPLLETWVNYDFFTGRPLTPEWISRASPPEEQATFYTPETAKIISKAFGGVLSPIQIEHLLSGFTAGATTRVMKVFDEIAGLKDHPGIAINPFSRFVSQQVHGQSSYVDQLYKLSVDLEQREDYLEPEDKHLKLRVDRAKRKISALRKQYREGEITREEAERESYEIARPLVEDR